MAKNIQLYPKQIKNPRSIKTFMILLRKYEKYIINFFFLLFFGIDFDFVKFHKKVINKEHEQSTQLEFLK